MPHTRPRRQLLYVMNPHKFMVAQYLIDWHERVRGDKVGGRAYACGLVTVCVALVWQGVEGGSRGRSTLIAPPAHGAALSASHPPPQTHTPCQVIVFSDNVWALEQYARALGKPFIYGGCD